MTVRQVFYQLASVLQVIDKTETQYKFVVRLLGDMRKCGEIPYGWIADSTRWIRKPDTYSNIESALRNTAECYRRAIWNNQRAYVEIWLEKEALAGVLVEETDIWDVPLLVTRGYPSLSYLYSAAETIKHIGKPTFLYYFGDYDPSGVGISENVDKRIHEMAPDVDIHFERAAVNPLQIRDWNLPTRPTKKTDTRSKNFQGESVEVDAIPPKKLRELVRECITNHIDESALMEMRVAEESEREIFGRIATSFTDYSA